MIASPRSAKLSAVVNPSVLRQGGLAGVPAGQERGIAPGEAFRRGLLAGGLVELLGDLARFGDGAARHHEDLIALPDQGLIARRQRQLVEELGRPEGAEEI